MQPVKRRRNKAPRSKPGASQAAAASAIPPGTPLSRRRLWLFRVAALVLVPSLLLGGTELALRVAGYGYPTGFFKHTSIGGEDCLVENDKFGLRFFPPELARSPAPLVTLAHKPPGHYRIFVFGESAALGDPAPAFGFSRYLEALLRERYPSNDFEIVNVAMTAINSHAILPIARECAGLDGDLWIIYMGNNEMVGPFGAATVFGAQAPPGWLVRTRLALGQMRLLQALEKFTSRWRSGSGRTWEGMKLFMENPLAPDNPKREIVYRNFQANLDAILRAGERAKVPIVLSTVAVNLKDFTPLASLPGGGAGTNLPPEFSKFVSVGTSAQKSGDWSSAIQAYDSALKLVPHHAETRFRLAQCQLAVANHVAALANFSQARDDDALPFRSDSRVNSIIEEVGRAHAQRGVRFFDAVATMSANSNVGIPGDESFYEHVHFHFDGNYRLARALAEKISAQFPLPIKQRSASDWATQEQCERDLGLTDWNRREVFDNVVRRLAQPPFAGQPGNEARMNFWRTRLNDLRRELSATNASTARGVYVAALQKRPGDFRLHWNFAEFLEATRDLNGAVAEWKKIQELIPHHHVSYYQVGRLLAEQGQAADARAWLNKALALRPDLAAGWLELGKLDAAEKHFDEALQHFGRARRLVPQESRIYYHTAKVYSTLKLSAEAIRQAQEAVRLDPRYWEAHSFLGEELAFSGRVQEAQREFETVLRINPDYPWAHLNLGVAFFQQGRREEAMRQFEEALRLDPQLALARQYLEQLKTQPVSNP